MDTIEAGRLQVTLEEMAKMLEVSGPTMRKWSRVPGFSIVRDGSHGLTWKFDPVEVNEWRDKHLDEAEAAIQHPTCTISSKPLMSAICRITSAPPPTADVPGVVKEFWD